MASISGYAKADEADLVGHLSFVIRVGDEEDTVAELVEWPHLKGSRVEYPTGSSRFREFCKAKSSIDGICGHAFGYRGNFFRTCSVSQGGDCLYLLPDLVKEKKYRHLGDEVSLEYVQGMVKDSRIDGFCCYLAQFDYGLTLPLSNLAKSRSDEEPLGLNNRTITKGINCKVSRKESFIDVVTREGTELEAVLKELDISRFKRVVSKDDKVRRSQAKRRMAGKTPGSMEEKLVTPELNTPLKLARLNKIPDGPVDMATNSSTVVRNLAKRKAIKRGAASHSVTSDSVDNSSKRRKVTSPTKSIEVVLEESDKIAEGADLRPRFEVEADLLEEQCRAKAQEKMVAVMDGEFKKGVQLGFQNRSIELEKRISQLEGEKNQLEENLTREREVFQLELEKEREVASLKQKEVRDENVVEAERLVTASAISRNNLAGKPYQLRYTKVEIMAFSEGNYEEKEIMDEEEVEEMEDGLNVVEKTAVDNWETINEERESSRLRVADLEGLLEVEKKSFAELQELDVVGERKEQTLLYNAEYTEEYEVLISQYEDRLDDNVKLPLKLEEAKRQVEDKTVTILSRDLALNQLTSKLVELKEKAASVVEEREIDLDTARTNLAVSEADFEKLSSSIVRKDQELRNSEQIRDSLIARLDRLKADLRRLKGREAQSRTDLTEIQTKNKSLVDDLVYARGNVWRVVQREKETNEINNQLCARISKSERELRVREMKY
ncbi:hypothetical protein GIB67_036478 [Kingdonia uniflora]|uniref:Uncharacterized protein n=1 Tax=Kingdonia uniflora TaxID=39325 RepID=A0A7J7P7H7_9MAGN|nr:hypothetical protein GIB67_036478 [Kingdonia uniflora]